MDNLDKEQWLKDIIQEVAEDHNVLLLANDPILTNAILNKKVLEHFHKKQEQLLDQIATKFIDQFEIQHQNDQKLFISVAEKLVKNFNPPVITKEYSTKKSKSDMLIIALVFILGLSLGYIFSMIN